MGAVSCEHQAAQAYYEYWECCSAAIHCLGLGGACCHCSQQMRQKNHEETCLECEPEPEPETTQALSFGLGHDEGTWICLVACLACYPQLHLQPEIDDDRDHLC